MPISKDVACEHTRSKIWATKCFLVFLAVVFAAIANFERHFAADEQFATVSAHLCIICVAHVVFNAWCDTADNATMTARQRYGEYLVGASDLYILWLCRDSKSSFSKGLIILVMPVYFTREARSPQSQALFGALHFAAVLAMFGGDVTGETAQWLVNLLIVNFIVVDMTRTRHAAEKARVALRDTLALNESLLLTSYDATCWGTFKNTQPGGLQPVIAFGNPLLSELFGWWKPMDGVVLDSQIITSGLDEIRDFFVEASQTQSLPEYRRRVLASCRDARGGTFEAEFRVAPHMREDLRREECFFLGVRIVGEKRQSLDEPTLEGEEPSSSDGQATAVPSQGVLADDVDDKPPQLSLQSGTPLWSWFWGSSAQQQARANEVRDPFDCRDVCWQVLTLVPGLLAVRCNTKSRLEVIAGTPDVLRCLPGILQRPVYELATQEGAMFMRRKFMNMLQAAEFASMTIATQCEDLGVFELRGDGGHACIFAALVSDRGASSEDAQTRSHFLVLISRQEDPTEKLEKPPGPAGLLRHRVLQSEDGIGSATSADALMQKAGPHMHFPCL